MIVDTGLCHDTAQPTATFKCIILKPNLSSSLRVWFNTSETSQKSLTEGANYFL